MYKINKPRPNGLGFMFCHLSQGIITSHPKINFHNLLEYIITHLTLYLNQI